MKWLCPSSRYIDVASGEAARPWSSWLHGVLSDPVPVLADAGVHTRVARLGTADAPRHDARHRPPVGAALLQQEGAAAVTLQDRFTGFSEGTVGHRKQPHIILIIHHKQ